MRVTLLFLAALALTRAADRREALDSLIEAERSFARASVEHGLRAAFLQFLDEGSIVFRPRPVDGRKTYTAEPEPKITLNWGPIFADVSAAGDLGYTTGPWTISEDKAGAKPLRYGHYMSVWRRKSSKPWRVAIDLGINHDKPGQLTDQVLTPSPSSKPASGGRAALLAADWAFSNASKSRGFAKAFFDFAAPGVRVYRRPHLPYTTPAEVRTAIEAIADPITWSPAGGEAAASGDLGYTYGIVRSPGDRGVEKAAYCRVWKMQPDGAWKVVVDVENPFPPAP
jgi:ketosteroid isomerase-like protein